MFPANLSAERRRTLDEKQFMFDIRVAPEQRPRLAYLIQCMTFQQITTLEVKGRRPLTQDQLHLELILRGWTIAPRGYERPACLERWANEVATFLQHQDDNDKVEGDRPDG